MTKKNEHPMVGLLAAGYVQKDKQNKYHDYWYASDEAVSKRLRDEMRNLGLYVKSFTIDSLIAGEVTRWDAKTKRDKVKSTALVQCTFIFSDGEHEYGPFQGAGSAEDSGDKHVYKAITGARKYALSQSCLLSWGNDPEGDATTDADAEAIPAQATETNGGSANNPKTKAPTTTTLKKPPPEDNSELSANAENALSTAKAVAPQGIEALSATWKLFSVELKRELSGHPRWEAIKLIAEDAKVPA